MLLTTAISIGLALLSLGAIATHVRASDRPVAAAPAVLALALAVATVVLQAAEA